MGLVKRIDGLGECIGVTTDHGKGTALLVSAARGGTDVWVEILGRRRLRI